MFYKSIGVFAVCLGFFSICFSQILPAPGSKINYTQVMFEHPAITGATGYIIEIVKDSAGTDFEHPWISRADFAPACIVNDLISAQKYSWRYTAVIDGKNQNWLGPYPFEIIYDSLTDNRFFRVRVEQDDSALNAHGLICLDQANCIVDRKGNVVWFALNGVTRKPMGGIRDLRVTGFGTITGLVYRTNVVYGSNAEPREYNLSMEPLWSAPLFVTIAGDTISSYHHSVERVGYDRYLTMGNKLAFCPFPGTDTVAFARYLRTKALSAKATNKQEQEVVMELNRKGELVWNWDPHHYFKHEDLVPASPDNNLNDLRNYGPHTNAAFADPTGHFVYVGFRDASRIVKVDMQTGKVLSSWGMKLPSGEAFEANGFFRNQHDIKILKNGNLAVYNNNTIGEKDAISGVVVFTAGDSTEHSRVTQNYECHFQPGTSGNKSTSGGGVDELYNGNLLVCMGVVNRTFEINTDNKVVWNAVVERRTDTNHEWRPCPLYRSHYTSSLYPCYFTTQTSCINVHKKSPAFTVKIFNVGTEPDSYTIKIHSASGDFQKTISSNKTGASKSQNFEINPGNNLNPNEKIEVTVSSITNPDLVRTMTILVKP